MYYERQGSLTMEVLAARVGELPASLLRERFELRPKDPRRYYIPPHRELRVDLSDYAGDEVVLLLRTIREGRVIVARGDLRGFGAIFENPRIVSRGVSQGGRVD